MAFDPVDFYSQARGWYDAGEQDRQAIARSIVSRAYYSAFLVARGKAGISPLGDNSHRATITHYSNSKIRSHLAIGNRLSQLSKKRREADYELDASVYRREAKIALHLARSVLDDLGAIV